jgi:hypothetical protein
VPPRERTTAFLGVTAKMVERDSMRCYGARAARVEPTVRLRIQWGNPWEFKSPLAHQLLSKHARAGLSVKNAKLSAITVRPPLPRPGAAA